MNTAVINFTTDPALKEEAQDTARKLGISLSLVLNNYLKQFIRTKTITFQEETPSEYLKSEVIKARRDRKAGKASPLFKSAKDSIKWLEEQGI